MVDGLHDRYHDLFVGPCDSETIEEDVDFPVIEPIAVSNETTFDCSYQEWQDLFREQARQAAQERAEQLPIAELVGRSAKRPGWVRYIQEIRLKDGTRIQVRRKGWVVIDSSGSFLASPEDAWWTEDEFDQDFPAVMLATPETAIKAWKLAGEVAKATARRQREARSRLKQK